MRREWTQRLHVYGIDLRHTPSVELLCQHLLATQPRLDALINNACQTVRRPSGWYDHVVDDEGEPPRDCRSSARCSSAIARSLGERRVEAAARAGSEIHATGPVEVARCSRRCRCSPRISSAASHLYPQGRLDQDLQQVDLRDFNSWRMTLAEVPTAELLEVHLVNAVAPFVLNARLRPLLAAVPDARRARRQRVGDGGPVLPAVEDRQASAHEHGEGRAQHDDAHVGAPTTCATAST